MRDVSLFPIYRRLSEKERAEVWEEQTIEELRAEHSSEELEQLGIAA